MTYEDIKAALDGAARDRIAGLFNVFLVKIETTGEDRADAIDKLKRGIFEIALAHKLATEAAGGISP